jgi:hypothetical protein
VQQRCTSKQRGSTSEDLTQHLKGVYCIMAEKRKPTHDLEAFKAAFSSVKKPAITDNGALPRRRFGV